MPLDFDLELKKKVKLSDSLMKLVHFKFWNGVLVTGILVIAYMRLKKTLPWTFPRIFDGLVLSEFPCLYDPQTKKDLIF